MSRYAYRLFLLCLLLLQFTLQAGTNDVTLQPTCILFKLNRSENKIQALKDRKRFDDVQLLQEYDEQIAQAIQADFLAHFNFCKVYFFNSDQLRDVIDKQWDKVNLYEKNLTEPVKVSPEILANFWIVENNFPPPPNYKIKDQAPQTILTSDSRTYANSNDENGLVSYDSQYELIEHKICYLRARLKKMKIPGTSPRKFRYLYTGAERYNANLKKIFRP